MKTTELYMVYKKCMYSYPKSAWNKGVNEYALELLKSYAKHYTEVNLPLLQKQLLNGTASWLDYSWSGNSLLYNTDIAQRLCTPSELKKCKNGQRKPNNKENWLNVQARTLFQAYKRIKRIKEIANI